MHDLRSRMQQLRADKQAAGQFQPTGIASTTEESLLFSSEAAEQPNEEPDYSRECY